MLASPAKQDEQVPDYSIFVPSPIHKSIKLVIMLSIKILQKKLNLHISNLDFQNYALTELFLNLISFAEFIVWALIVDNTKFKCRRTKFNAIIYGRS